METLQLILFAVGLLIILRNIYLWITLNPFDRKMSYDYTDVTKAAIIGMFVGASLVQIFI